jgi:hypothetical protein
MPIPLAMRLSQPVAAAALMLGVSAALAAASPAHAAADPLDRTLARGSITEPEYALARADALFHPRRFASRYPGARRPGPHDATGVLRRLRAALPALRGRELAHAERLLARPTQDSDPYGLAYAEGVRTVCTQHVCVHWVVEGADAPSLADTDHSGSADWAETTAAVFEEVWAKEVGALGYRPPLDDDASDENGGDGRLDVYLADVGADGYFGWCTSDDPASWANREVSAYCVLDNDYRNPDFDGLSPRAALEVTAAHEFFHAVQFAYDWLEDLWLMEGTAAWIEDVVYDGVNDNFRYLRDDSPIVEPGVPLDRGRGGFEYGAWIFWRYLSERKGNGIVRRVWSHAAASSDSGDYSLAAVRHALAERHTSFERAFAGFTAANAEPAGSYSEGTRYPRAPRSVSVLGGARWSSGPQSARVAHLASRVVAFRPAGGHVLRISVDLPRGAARASVVVVPRSGRPRVRRIRTDGAGHGIAYVAFSPAIVQRVDLVLTNADTRYACWRGTDLSCHGVPLDDGRRFAFEATVS